VAWGGGLAEVSTRYRWRPRYSNFPSGEKKMAACGLLLHGLFTRTETGPQQRKSVMELGGVFGDGGVGRNAWDRPCYGPHVTGERRRHGLAVKFGNVAVADGALDR